MRTIPQIADLTAPFVYARIMGTREDEAGRLCRGGPRPLGRGGAELGRGVGARCVADARRRPRTIAPARDVFLYVISGAKRRNPAAAMALIERVG